MFAIALVADGASTDAAPSSAADFVALTPGRDPVFNEDLTVNVVRIGFAGRIDSTAFAGQLPSANWVARGAEGGGRTVELSYNYHYNIVDVPASFEDFFFGILRSVAVLQPPLDLSTLFPALTAPVPIAPDQAIYNFCNLDRAYAPDLGCEVDPSAVRVNPRLITENYLLEAPFVEVLLSRTLRSLGVDVTSPTIVLINWWGRDDFVDHVYLNIDEPVHETGVPRGLYLNNILGAWGGTPDDDPQTCARFPCVPHRLWFVDLSAGPFLTTDSWDLVASDSRTRASEYSVPGVADYRIHHVADYELATSATYRPLNTLTADLSKLVGDVFLGLIATTSPIYPPALSAPLLPEEIQLDLNRYRWGDPRDLNALLDLNRVGLRLSKLPYRFTTELTEQRDPRNSRIGDAAFSVVSRSNVDGIYGWRLVPTADLYLYWRDHLSDFLEGDADYEIPVFQFAFGSSDGLALAGLAEANWATPQRYPNTDGARIRQTFSLVATTPDMAPYIGHGTLIEHEVGHHLGLPHPFHGSRCLDSRCEQERVLLATDGTAYSWQGAFVHGVMTYVHVNDDFSRFERDNLSRWVTYQQVRYANYLAADILKRPGASSVAASLAAADAHAANAVADIASRNYERAAREARAAYDSLLLGASLLHLTVEAPAPDADLRTPPDLHKLMRDSLRAPSTVDPADLSQGYRGRILHPALRPLGNLVQDHFVLERSVPLPRLTQLRYEPN